MVNPRYIKNSNEPTAELLHKLDQARKIFFGELESFCDKEQICSTEMKKVDRIYLIGSHATEDSWNNNSDLDFKLVIPDALPMDLSNYKRRVLDPKLCPKNQEKSTWIDLFFARDDYQVRNPRVELTPYWNKL